MANLITSIRLCMIFIIVALALYAPPIWQLLNIPLVIINITLDGLDGIIARARAETSPFGAIYDIAADRIIEITLWIVLAQLNMVSIWISLIFVVRGILVDSLRKHSTKAEATPFSIMKTQLGKYLVSGRVIRFLYGLMKLITFAWLLLMLPLPNLLPYLYYNHDFIFNSISNILITITVLICLIRGIPVIIESFIAQ